ncbi:MAG: hypothetical protein FWE63_03885 [Bacteroidales bacterium]|nr:hypothetical protein [Bacteroidales bacterium]
MEQKEFDEQKARYRETLVSTKYKSEEFYEKNITYITAGTLALSLTFIDRIVTLNNSCSIWLLITSWSILALTLLINLTSHQVSSWFHDKNIRDLDNLENSDNSKQIFSNNFYIRNKKLWWMNFATTFGLITGIIFLIIFCSININL